MRRLSICARGQLPLLFSEMPAAHPDVWPALSDHTRRAALILLAELIARAADPSTAEADRRRASGRNARQRGRP